MSLSDTAATTTGGASSFFSSLGSKSFVNHVFNTSEEGKAELINTVQYSLFALLPILALNKLIQRFIPEADPDKSSLELVIEIVLQVIVMFVGIVLVHRIVTYFPTYSGFKYEHLALTNVMLAFLMILMSIQTKLGIKVNILVDRLSDVWNGTPSGGVKGSRRQRVSGGVVAGHRASQGDWVDSSPAGAVYPPQPTVTSKAVSGGNDYMLGGGPAPSEFGPAPANSFVGNLFK